MIMRGLLIVMLSCSGLSLVIPAAAQTAKPAMPVVPATPQGPLPTLNIVVPERDRQAVYGFYRDEIAAGRCPPPLVRRDKACGAPARPARQLWKLDQPLADDVKAEPPPAVLIAKLSASPAGYQYLRVDTDILLVGIGTRIVTALVADLSRI
jgi:hypothetical protein